MKRKDFLGTSLGLLVFAPMMLAAQSAQAPYVWKNAVIRGGGFVSGIMFSPVKKDLVYVRTDVGGAYRSDDGGEHWIPLNDGLSRKDSNYTGIESLATDPSDANKVYLATGLYISKWSGMGAMLRSSDQGRTWQGLQMPFKMGGNVDGRNCGEKLAVDPNLGSVLYFGSRKDGLWKSVDSGASWSVVGSFPSKDGGAGPWGPLGISFVMFDPASGGKGAATPGIYVGVASEGASLYRSDDAGTTWHLVPGAPKGLFPCHAVSDAAGDVYFNFNNNIGPNGITDGAVEKYNSKTGKWKDVSPISPGVGDARKFGFGGIGMDAEHPETLVVTTIDRWSPRDLIFRTTDGGKHWKEIYDDAQYAAPNAPWQYWHKDRTGGTGWMSDIEIDPFNPAKVMYTTGAGLWGSVDLTQADKGKPTHWGFPDDGLEETVPLALISPTEGAHLISGVGDIGGFVHDDLDKSPAGGFFDEPRFNNTDSLDYAALKPMMVVRVGQGGYKIVHGAYSANGGVTWKEFASEPPSSKDGGGAVAISADGAVVIWMPNQGAAFWSADMGRTWASCGGLGQGMRVISDRVNPDRFYSFEAKSGTFLVSVDKGKTFHNSEKAVGSSGGRAFLTATQGFEGDVWVVVADSVYRTRDFGKSFTKVEGFTKVFAVGLGKAAPGETQPAVYLAGERESDSGMYRSDDGGKRWVRINDDQHQFGAIRQITGDPRVYGRVYVATGGRGVIYGDLSEVRAH